MIYKKFKLSDVHISLKTKYPKIWNLDTFLGRQVKSAYKPSGP